MNCFNRALTIAFAIAFSTGCYFVENNRCVPGRVEVCGCPMGGTSTQTCGETGTFGPCICGVDADDARVDASSDGDAGQRDAGPVVDADRLDAAADVDSGRLDASSDVDADRTDASDDRGATDATISDASDAGPPPVCPSTSYAIPSPPSDPPTSSRDMLSWEPTGLWPEMHVLSGYAPGVVSVAAVTPSVATQLTVCLSHMASSPWQPEAYVYAGCGASAPIAHAPYLACDTVLLSAGTTYQIVAVQRTVLTVFFETPPPAPPNIDCAHQQTLASATTFQESRIAESPALDRYYQFTLASRSEVEIQIAAADFHIESVQFELRRNCADAASRIASGWASAPIPGFYIGYLDPGTYTLISHPGTGQRYALSYSVLTPPFP